MLLGVFRSKISVATVLRGNRATCDRNTRSFGEGFLEESISPFTAFLGRGDLPSCKLFYQHRMGSLWPCFDGWTCLGGTWHQKGGKNSGQG